MRILSSRSALRLTSALLVVFGGALRTSDARPCFPCITIGPVTLTPAGPVPTAVVNPADQAVNKVVDAGRQGAVAVGNAAVGAATAAGTALVSPQLHIFKVIAGQESLSDAAKGLVQDQGKQISSVGEVISTTNAATNNLKIVAAESITGDVGQTIMTISTGADRLQVEFAATSAIEAGKVVGGTLSPEKLIAAPLAAGIRSAEKQFESQAKPLPPEVIAQLSAFYPADILRDARWAVGSVSLSVPDLTNLKRRYIDDVENAVTVGHVTVFVRDPGNSYHWWAHEIQHQVQYKMWGIDDFAYKYLTSCHDVESDAENKAQQAVPVVGTVSLGC